MKTLGSRIKFIRGKESQDSFANKIGVSKGSLGGYERDENSPSADAILKICSKTDISAEWLLTGKGPMRVEENTGGVYSADRLNKAILVDVIEVLEEVLSEAKKKLPPVVKAELIYQLYQLVVEEEADAKQQPIRMFRLIQGALAANE